MARMSKHIHELTEDQINELIALLEREDGLSNCLHVNGKPLTLEMRRKMSWPLTLEEAMANMERSKQEAERKSSPKRKTA
jgi:hypothetical protein